ncbi:MAG: SAM-dependent methyltransferase, partial [Candidatus Ruminococcus intestinipullorum]|nr:SAM-dependent methyltransferase [Candidatus Ruminococcus intestinipullorum]
MKVIPLVNKHEKETWNHIELKYGKLLLQNRHPILKKYLEKEERLKSEIYNKLEAQQGEKIQKRKEELAIELEYIKKGLEYYAV